MTDNALRLHLLSCEIDVVCLLLRIVTGSRREKALRFKPEGSAVSNRRNNMLHALDAFCHPFAAFNFFLGLFVIVFITKWIKTEDIDAVPDPEFAPKIGKKPGDSIGIFLAQTCIDLFSREGRIVLKGIKVRRIWTAITAAHIDKCIDDLHRARRRIAVFGPAVTGLGVALGDNIQIDGERSGRKHLADKTIRVIGLIRIELVEIPYFRR